MSTFKRAAYKGGSVPEVDETKCTAYGCKCRGTVSLGGGYMCSWHAFADPSEWQSLTSHLHQNGWLVDFIAEMQTMDNASKDWRGFAIAFWENEPRCAPVGGEEAIPYQNRMRYELAYRTGQLKKAPEPRLPAAVKPSGRFATAGAL